MATRSDARGSIPDATPEADAAASVVLQVAERLHAMNPEWVVFFREVLGVEGIVRRSFPETGQFGRIGELLDDLRSRQRERPVSREAQRVVTVRMPKSLHESLKAEAESMRVSINTLCISKLLKLLDEEERRDLASAPGEGPEAA